MSLKKVQEGLESPRQQAQTLETAAWAYGMPSDAGGPFDNGRVLHAIVLKAMELDLMVLADYLGVAFLPGEELVVESDLGVDWELLFEEPAGEEHKPQAEPRMTRAQMVKRVVAMLGDKLKPHGFVLSKEWPPGSGRPPADKCRHWFVREVGEGLQFIEAVDGADRRHGLTFLFDAGGQNRLLHPVLLSAFPERREALFKEDYGLYLKHLAVYQNWRASGRHHDVWTDATIHSGFPVQIEHGPLLEEAVGGLLDVIVSAYVPIRDAITDVHGIVRLFLRGHGRLVEKKVAMAAENRRAAIVAGHLARDPALPEFVQAVCEDVRAGTQLNEEEKERVISRVRQLVHYLEESVAPWH